MCMAWTYAQDVCSKAALGVALYQSFTSTMDPREHGDREGEPAAAVLADRQEDSPSSEPQPARARERIEQTATSDSGEPAAITLNYDPILPQIQS